MSSDRKTAVIVGALFIVATAFFAIGQAIHGPILGSPDYLDNAYPDRATVMAGMLTELIGVLGIILIPAFLFPVLRRHNEAVALGYAGFRFLEATLLIIAVIGGLSMITLSQGYLAAGGADAAYYQATGSLIQSGGHWAFLLSVAIVFPLGALMLYTMLYTSKLVPRAISGWGFIAAALLLVGSVLAMFDVFAGVSQSILELILTIPIAAQEMVLALWLIVKGFSEPTVAPASEPASGPPEGD